MQQVKNLLASFSKEKKKKRRGNVPANVFAVTKKAEQAFGRFLSSLGGGGHVY